MNLSQDEIERLGNNPIRGANLVVNGVEQDWFNGSVQINSKTHPIVLAIDLILGTSHGFLNRLADANSRKFAKHARNISELSRNMADEERIGLFAYPASSVAQVAMSVDMFMDLSLSRTEVLGNNSVTYQELLVPKDTILPISGYDFAILNGVRIQLTNAVAGASCSMGLPITHWLLSRLTFWISTLNRLVTVVTL